MKPIFIRLLAFLLPLTTALSANAQTRVHSLAFTKIILDSAAKNLVRQERDAAAEADAKTLATLETSSSRLHHNFTTKFREAYEIGVAIRKNIHITCLVNGIRNRALYTKSGRLLHNIRYYESSALPESVIEKVYDVYPGYQFFGGVTEVQAYGQTVYFVLIEDKQTWKQVKVTGETVEVHENFKKTTDQQFAANTNIQY